MSELPRESLSYQAVVAEYFLGLRGTGLLLSPLDEELVAEWERRGIPVPVVCRGLKQAHAALLAERAPGSPAPRALRAYRFGVEEEWRTYRHGRVGDAPPPPPQLLAAAQRLESARRHLDDLGHSAHGARREGYRAARAALDAAGTGTGPPTLESVDAAIDAADRTLLRAFTAALPRAERAALGARLQLRAGFRPTGATRRSWRDTLRAHLADAAREAGYLGLRGSV